MKVYKPTTNLPTVENRKVNLPYGPLTNRTPFLALKLQKGLVVFYYAGMHAFMIERKV
jgi:hypothetical protein